MKHPFFDLGDGTSIPEKKVVLILNAETATLQSTTRRFLRKQSEKGNAVLPKKPIRQANSLILCNAYGRDSLYTSSRSARSLVSSPGPLSAGLTLSLPDERSS